MINYIIETKVFAKIKKLKNDVKLQKDIIIVKGYQL